MNISVVAPVKVVCTEVPSSPIDQAVICMTKSSIRMFKHAVENENMDGRWNNWKVSLLLHRRALVRTGVPSQDPVRKELEDILAAFPVENV